MKNKNNILKLMVPIISILISFLVGGILIFAIGGDPKTAYLYLFKGAFGSQSNISETFIKATPLIFTGLAATFAYKCGVFNLGADGQFAMGAVASVWFSTNFDLGSTVLNLTVSILLACVAGGIWGAIAGLLKITRGLNEMIVTILLNYVATLFMGYLYSGPMREGSVPQTAAVPWTLGRIFPDLRVHWGVVIALVLAVVIYYLLNWTSFGFKLRAVGLNQTASRFNGFDIKKYMLIAFIASGAIAGIGGSVEIHGTQFRLMSGFGDGYGFDGVAIALIGQLNPIATVLVAYLFAVLRTGATTMQVASGMPTSVIDIIQALVIVFAVAGTAIINLPRIRQKLIEQRNKTSKKEVQKEC